MDFTANFKQIISAQLDRRVYGGSKEIGVPEESRVLYRKEVIRVCTEPHRQQMELISVIPGLNVPFCNTITST